MAALTDPLFYACPRCRNYWFGPGGLALRDGSDPKPPYQICPACWSVYSHVRRSEREKVPWHPSYRRKPKAPVHGS